MKRIEHEEWRDVDGFVGRYQVSNLGNVKSLRRITQLNGRVREEPEKIMAVTLRSGYPTIILRKGGERCSRQVHRLVAEAFLPNPNGYPVVNHKDSDRTNNNVSNLEWCTVGDNVRWSAERMSHPKANSKTPKSGEKYIKETKSGTFSIAIQWKSFVYYATLPTLEEAIIRRDEVLRGGRGR